ncbi:MAG: DNA polymerase III subunit delta [Cytophagales bacterium]|nr:DNA polymerase III subunit delta [Cytophagales bacterium]
MHHRKFAPVYFLQGDEPFFIDNILANLDSKVLEESQKSFNQYVLYGKETSFEQVISTARKFPMMGELQVIIVKEAQEMKGWLKEADQQLLIQYLENPTPSTVLAFGYKYKTLDKRTKLGKSIGKLTMEVLSKKLYDNKVPSWIQGYVQAVEATMTDGACMLLSESIGNNLQRLANEIDKLLLNVGADKAIDEALVHKYVGISKEYNTFELQKAIGTRNLEKAMRIVRYFAENPKNNPLILTLFSLYAYFSKLVLVHGSQNNDQNHLAKVIGVNPFFVGEYIGAARNYNMQRVLRNLEHLHKADLQSKGIGFTNMKEKEVLTELIFKLMH